MGGFYGVLFIEVGVGGMVVRGCSKVCICFFVFFVKVGFFSYICRKNLCICLDWVRWVCSMFLGIVVVVEWFVLGIWVFFV